MSILHANFVQELSGVFEMRIYDGEHSVGRILEECRVSRRDSEMNNSRVVDGVDLDKLSKRLDQIPVQKIRERRARMNIFYEEVLVSADPDRGISFTSCLMILAHYKVISDSKSLRYASSLVPFPALADMRFQARRIPSTPCTAPTCRGSCASKRRHWFLRHHVLVSRVPSASQRAQVITHGGCATILGSGDLCRRSR